MMKKVYIVILVIISGWVMLNAQDLSGIDPGYYDYDSRAAAMGSAGAASGSGSPSVLLGNSAALDLPNSLTVIQFTNSSYLGIISYNLAGAAWERDNYNMALAATFCGDEAMSEYELYLGGSCSGTKIFGEEEIWEALRLGASFKLGGSSYGSNENGAYYDENGLNHQVKGNSYGFAVNWGAQYQLNQYHRIGLYNRNLLNTVFWNSANDTGTAQGEYREARPVGLVLGYLYREGAASLCLDYDLALYSDRNSLLRSGLEIDIYKERLYLRSGICTKLFSLETVHYDLGCGINLAIAKKQISLNIAYRIFPAWQGANNLVFGIKSEL